MPKKKEIQEPENSWVYINKIAYELKKEIQELKLRVKKLEEQNRKIGPDTVFGPIDINREAKEKKQKDKIKKEIEEIGQLIADGFRHDVIREGEMKKNE